MLTESEKRWLQDRAALYHHSCFLCHEQNKRTCRYYCRIHKSYKSELKDAAEFEGRVAAELAEMAQYNIKFGCEACPAYIDDAVPCKPYCAALLLKTAQLAVEEEMDANTE